MHVESEGLNDASQFDNNDIWQEGLRRVLSLRVDVLETSKSCLTHFIIDKENSILDDNDFSQNLVNS